MRVDGYRQNAWRRNITVLTHRVRATDTAL